MTDLTQNFALSAGGPSWTLDDTERWLTDFPLPANFAWHGKPVLPKYHLKKGYGFWLRTTPYHQGLFEDVHRILARIVADPAWDRMPTPDELAKLLIDELHAQGTQETLL